MTKRVLAVCGDSWYSSVHDYPGESFGEIICDRHDLELFSLARGGASNFAIALQIDEAIKRKVDFIICGTTSPDRIEIPINVTPYEEIAKWFNWQFWSRISSKTYKKVRGLANVQYKPHPDLSSDHEWLNTPSIIAESINNLAFMNNNFDHYKDVLTENRMSALKHYLTELYDNNIKQQYDSWLFSDAARRLVRSNIPFLLVTYPLLEHDYFDDISWVDSKNLITNKDFYYYDLPPGPARFHTSYEGSILFADYIQDRLQQQGFI